MFDFITDLPHCAAEMVEDSIMTVMDRATKMVHLIPCKKTTDSRRGCTVILAACGQVTRSSSGNPHRSGCPVFVGRWWREIWTLLGTKLRFGTAYHPQSQGQVERMNAVVSQTLRCLDDRRPRSEQVERLSSNRRDGNKLTPEQEYRVQSIFPDVRIPPCTCL